MTEEKGKRLDQYSVERIAFLEEGLRISRAEVDRVLATNDRLVKIIDLLIRKYEDY